MLWKVPLHPARRSASFGQQTSGNEAVGWGNLPENDVLSQYMVTEEEGQMLCFKVIQNLCVEIKLLHVFIINTSNFFPN